jgi:hypothetical protein
VPDYLYNTLAMVGAGDNVNNGFQVRQGICHGYGALTFFEKGVIVLRVTNTDDVVPR